MRELLTMQNVTARYQSPDGELTAAENISLTVSQGEFVSIVGPSGCGKSTLLTIMAGLKRPSEGKVLLDGEPITGPGGKIGYMLQKDNLLEWRTIYKNILLGLEIRNRLTPENIEYARGLLRTYGLWDFRDRYPSQLSGGMRQRVALIRTLAVKPEIFLLDEAFSALDYQTRLTVTDDIYSILRREGQTMVMVTHDIPESVSMSDRVVVLSGRPAGSNRSIPLNSGISRLWSVGTISGSMNTPTRYGRSCVNRDEPQMHTSGRQYDRPAQNSRRSAEPICGRSGGRNRRSPSGGQASWWDFCCCGKPLPGWAGSTALS